MPQGYLNRNTLKSAISIFSISSFTFICQITHAEIFSCTQLFFLLCRCKPFSIIAHGKIHGICSFPV